MLCIWTMRSSQPAFAATFKGGKKKKTKMVENAFLTDQCTKFIFALLVCWFYLIRTQAFSVFSRCRVVAPQWDRTIHTRQRIRISNCMNKRDGLWMTSCSLLSHYVCLSLFPIFSCSSPRSLSHTVGRIFVMWPATSSVVLPFLKQSWHQRAAAALYLHKLVDVCVVLTV